MNSKLILREGTSAEYNALPVKDEGTLYFLTDTHEIYKGSHIAGTASIVTDSPLYKDSNGNLDIRYGNGITKDSDNKLILRINETDQYLEFVNGILVTKLPQYTTDDASKYLKVNETGTGIEWVSGSGQTVEWDDITNKPSTVSGYGITDAYTKTDVYTKTEVEDAFSAYTDEVIQPITSSILQLSTTKVDKEEGKGLSTNDFTNELKDKLDGIEEGAEVNVQSDWNITDTSLDSYIKNKPDLTTKLEKRNHNDQAYTLSTIESWFSDYNSNTGQPSCVGIVKFAAGQCPIQPGAQVALQCDYIWLADKQDGTNSQFGILILYSHDFSEPRWCTVKRVNNAWNNPNTYYGDIRTLTNTWTNTNNFTGTLQKSGVAVATVNDLNTKVDKVEGKGLSTNDYTTDDKTKVTNLPTDTANIVVDANYVHTDNNFTTDEKAKLFAIESGAEVNVQSDWNETNSASDAYIKNKPTITEPYYTTVTIETTDWDDQQYAEKTIFEIIPGDNTTATPVGSSFEAAAESMVYLYERNVNILRFKYGNGKTKPTVSLTFNITIE